MQPVAGSQVPGPQISGFGFRQLPAPSQVPAAMNLLSPVHIAAVHWVLEDHLRQVPVASQLPSKPQLLLLAAGHAVPQQTLPTQIPLMHSVPDPDGQAPPFGFSPEQVPPRQVYPEAQSVATEQFVLHRVAPQA